MKEKSVLHDTVNSQKKFGPIRFCFWCMFWRAVSADMARFTCRCLRAQTSSHIFQPSFSLSMSLFFVVLRILLQPISHTKIRIPSSKNLTIEERTRSWRWLPSLLWFPWSGQQLHSKRIHDAMQGRVVDGEYASQGVDAVGQRRCGGGGSGCRV